MREKQRLDMVSGSLTPVQLEGRLAEKLPDRKRQPPASRMYGEPSGHPESMRETSRPVCERLQQDSRTAFYLMCGDTAVLKAKAVVFHTGPAYSRRSPRTQASTDADTPQLHLARSLGREFFRWKTTGYPTQ